MANSIDLAKKFEPIVDDIYKAASVTEGIDTPSQRPDFLGVNEVKILKVATTGLGDYDRETGYPKGDVTATWETLTLSEERGKEISIDRLDDEETLGMTFGTVVGDFMRIHVVPELDAYRFAKYAQAAGISKATPAALTKESILPALDEASRQADEDEVPLEGRRLFLNSDLKPVLSSALQRQWGSDAVVNTMLAGYNGMDIVYVPKKRFFTKIVLNSGASSWGYAKASDGMDINFMLLHPSAVLQVVKFALPKIFDPDTNQLMDSWKFQYREYHDAFVYENKAKGVYLHSNEA